MITKTFCTTWNEIAYNNVVVGISPIETIPPRRIRWVIAINADLLRRLNDIGDDNDEWSGDRVSQMGSV